MRGWRSVLSGFAMAVLLILILGGSLLLSIVEGGSKTSEQPTATFTMTSFPVTTQFIITGRPSRTATSTLIATATPTSTLTPTSIPTQTSTSVPPSVCPPPEGWMAIVVLPGDTLSGLASIYQADEDTLARGNCLEPGVTTLQPGEVFYVPRPSPLPSLPFIQPLLFTPVYTLPAPPSSMNEFAPMANWKTTAPTFLIIVPGMGGWSE